MNQLAPLYGFDLRRTKKLKSVCGAGLFCLCDNRFDIQAQPLRHALPISRIGLVEMVELQLLNALRHAIAEAGDDIVDQPLPGVRGHKPEEIARLRIVITVEAMIVPRYGSAHGMRPFDVGPVLRRAGEAVRLVVYRRAAVSVK